MSRVGAPAHQVARAVAWRSVKTYYSRPALFVPSIVFPLFFFTAFAGGLNNVGNLPGFDYPAGYTTFQWCFTMLQGATFAGVFLGFSVLRDFDTGFFRRLLLATPRHRGIVLGFSAAAAVRMAVTVTVITMVGIVVGVNYEGSAAQLVAVAILALTLNQSAALWAVGVAMRVRNVQGGPIIQIPMFVVFFLAPVFVPINLLTGWIKAVARVNPITPIINAVRGLVAGAPVQVGAAFLSGVALVVLALWWSMRSLRRAEAAG